VWAAYLKRMLYRVGCWTAANLAWSPDGSHLACNCGPQIEVLELHGSGHMTLPTGTDAFSPAWSPAGTRIAYSTRLKPSHGSSVYTMALDGSHRRLVAGSGTAPASSPDGRMIAYQTRCGVRLATPSGKDVTPRAETNWCGSSGKSGPPVWSPDGTKLALETDTGVYVMNSNAKDLHYAGIWRPQPGTARSPGDRAGGQFARRRRPRRSAGRR
jgi:WD40-like Beta Propeller Repeat